jgi:hypothetical protein
MRNLCFRAAVGKLFALIGRGAVGFVFFSCNPCLCALEWVFALFFCIWLSIMFQTLTSTAIEPYFIPICDTEFLNSNKFT